MTQQDARDSPARTFLRPGDQFPPTVAIPTHPPIRSRHFQRAALGLGRQLVLRLGVEIAGVVTLMQLRRGIALQPVDDAPALHGRAGSDRVGPTLHVLVFMHGQEFAGSIQQALRQTAISAIV